jgi:hypothetical protein
VHAVLGAGSGATVTVTAASAALETTASSQGGNA